MPDDFRSQSELVLDRGVLIVEDDPDLQSSLAREVMELGFRVVGARSGDAALALLDEWPMGLVLLDESLPDGSGIDVAQALRAKNPDSMSMLMVNAATPEIRTAARHAGIAKVLEKPVNVLALLDAIGGAGGASERERDLLAAE